MLFLKTLLVTMLYSLTILAVSSDQVKESFINNPVIKAEIAKAKNLNLTVDNEVGVVFLSESCGFIGCIGHYLASVGVHPREGLVNPQSTSILAKIIFNNNAFFSLTLMNSSQI